MLTLQNRHRGTSRKAMSLVELIVSISILSFVLAAFAYSLQAALFMSRDNKLRLQASSLAARELEITRNNFYNSEQAPEQIGQTTTTINPNPLTNQTEGQDFNMGGTLYTVSRTIRWNPAGQGQSPCDGGATLTYPSLAVQVQVSWTEKGLPRSTTNSTILTPPKGTVSEDKSFVAVKITGADGLAKPAAVVNLQKSTGGAISTTNTLTDGCAVFQVEDTGSYNVILDSPGWVNFEGQQNVSKPVDVAAGTLHVVPFSYDEQATLNIVKKTLPEHSVPDSINTTLYNPSLMPTGTKEVSTNTVNKLWPYAEGYTLWSGTCLQNDPGNTSQLRPPATIIDPADSATANAFYAPLTLNIIDDLSQPLSSQGVWATPVDDSGCAGLKVFLGQSDENGIIKTSLPAGVWFLTPDQEQTCTIESCLQTPLLDPIAQQVVEVTLPVGAP